MSQTSCLVVGSCTGMKDDKDCPREIKLQDSDFETVGRRRLSSERRSGSDLPEECTRDPSTPS